MSDRVANELQHGKYLAEHGAQYLWGWGTPAGEQRARRRGKLVAETAGLGPGVKALEVGCGTGLFTEAFVATGAHVLAVDLSPELLAAARERNYTGGSVDFVEARFESVGERGPFDAIIGSSVLHHLVVEEALERMVALLRDDGCVVFAEPNMLNPQIFVERKFRRLFPFVSPDETAFVRGRLAGQMREAGLRDIRIVPFDWLHPLTPRWLIPAVKATGGAFEKIPLVREFSGSLLICAKK